MEATSRAHSQEQEDDGGGGDIAENILFQCRISLPLKSKITEQLNKAIRNPKEDKKWSSCSKDFREKANKVMHSIESDSMTKTMTFKPLILKKKKKHRQSTL